MAHRLLLVVNNINGLGGMEVQLTYLAGGLARLGHHVRLVSIRTRDGQQGPPVDDTVEVVHLGASSRNDQPRATAQLFAHARWSDLVHCTGWDASLWGRLAAIAARRPVVVAEHSAGREHQISGSGAPRGQWIARHNRVLDPFTAVTVVCANWQRSVLEGEGVDRRKIAYIPNGVPVARLRDRARHGLTRSDLGIPADAPVLAHVARFRPQKRQQLTLETAEALRATHADLHIVFAGDGPDLEAVRSRAAEMGAGWAHFLGRQDNVPAILRLADAVVLPSVGEAMPMVILEAIAVGVPVVATAVGDVATILERTGAGVHVPPEDTDGFKAACRTLLGDPELRAGLAAAAERARTEIDAATMATRYADLFDVVLRRSTIVGAPAPAIS